MPKGIYDRLQSKSRGQRTAKSRARISAGNKNKPKTTLHRKHMSCARLKKYSPIRLMLNGYAVLRFLNGNVLAHRAAWVYYHGPIPEKHVIHHVNGDKLDNSVENLELMTRNEHTKLHAILFHQQFQYSSTHH